MKTNFKKNYKMHWISLPALVLDFFDADFHQTWPDMIKYYQFRQNSRNQRNVHSKYKQQSDRKWPSSFQSFPPKINQFYLIQAFLTCAASMWAPTLCLCCWWSSPPSEPSWRWRRTPIYKNSFKKSNLLPKSQLRLRVLFMQMLILSSLLAFLEKDRHEQFLKFKVSPAAKESAQPRSPSWSLAAFPSSVSPSPCQAASKGELFSQREAASRSQQGGGGEGEANRQQKRTHARAD